MYTANQDKFAVNDLQTLRSQLLSMGADYDGAAEIIYAFLSGRGYGISPDSARHAAFSFAIQGCSLDSIRQALNDAALVA